MIAHFHFQAEKQFVTLQTERKEQQQLLIELQSKLRDVSAELDKLNRGDPQFLETITKQHAMFRQEMVIAEKHQNLERGERNKFLILSAAVRESHEKERTRTERTKYWSVIGSVVGALIGITGATLNNFLRNRELKKLGQTVRSQHSEIESLLVDFKSSVNELGGLKPSEEIAAKGGDGSTLDILKTLKGQNENANVQLGDIKQLVLAQGRGLGEGAVVYVGPEIEGLLGGLAEDLEYKIKINSLATVAFAYGAIAVAIPILYALFSGR